MLFLLADRMVRTEVMRIWAMIMFLFLAYWLTFSSYTGYLETRKDVEGSSHDFFLTY
jgi:hypothetical protein